MPGHAAAGTCQAARRMPSLRHTAPWALLAAYAALLLALSWQRWGNPLMDPGLDLTVAAGWLDGVMPYRDVRYWYGPLGIGALSGTFAVFGTSLASAYGFGLVQTAVIAELWRRLARRWLPNSVALAGVAVVLAIGFSGSLFNFQLPHTASATTGLIALLAALLAMADRRPWLAGLAIGACALTRPEFLAFGVAAAGGMAFGLWRTESLGAAAGAVARMAATALLVAVPVLGFFAAEAGADRFFFENIVPIEFLEVSATFEKAWHPYDLPSLGTLLLRGVVVLGGALTLLRLAEAWGGATQGGVRSGRRLQIVAGPIAAFAVAVVASALVATALGLVGGDAGQPVRAVASDLGRLLFPMTALPALGFVVLAGAAVAWLRRAPAPLSDGLPGDRGPGWPADAALIAAAAACGLRSYGTFSTDVYATYYAPPLVLVAAIVLWRASARLTQRRVAAASAVLVACALVLTAHATLGRYVDFTERVTAPRGEYRAPADSAANIQGVIDLLAPRVRPGEPLLELPQEPGFHFLLGTRPALYDVTLLPGTLATRADDERAARDLIRARPRFVIEAARNLSQWGFRQSGVDVNVVLTQAIRERYCVLARFGDTARLAPSDLPARAFTVLALRPEIPASAAFVPTGRPAPPAPDC